MRIITFLLLLISIHTFAGFESDFTKIIDTNFEKHAINWEKAKTEFFTYTKSNFNENRSISNVLSKIKGRKKKRMGKGSFPFLIENKAPNLKKMASISSALFKELEDFTFAYIGEGMWDKYHAEIHIAIYLNYLNQWPLTIFSDKGISKELLDLEFQLSKYPNIFEKIALLTLAKKIIDKNTYKSQYVIAEKRCRTITIHKPQQNKNSTKSMGEEIFPTKEPHFVGGVEAMALYITKNVVYPKEAVQLKIQGIVYVRFAVETDGSLTDFLIYKSPNDLLSKEAIRVVQEMPNWTIGELKGEKVRVRFTLPIYFRIS